MATKSISKDVRITNKTLGRAFASALENCSGKAACEVVVSKKVREVRDVDEVRRIFNKKAD